MSKPSRGRVLLVDDEQAALDSCTRTLDDAGYDVISAPDVEMARALLKEERFDVMLSDVSMSDMGGLGLLRDVREHHIVPVIMAPEGLDPGARSVLEEQGALECLVKPISPNVLERTMERAVKASRSRRSGVSFQNRRGEEVSAESFTATYAKNKFGHVLQIAGQTGIVVITHHDEPCAVLLSFDEFSDLAAARETKLDALRVEFDSLLARMQTPGVRDALKAAFDASPERLGEAAIAAARARD